MADFSLAFLGMFESLRMGPTFARGRRDERAGHVRSLTVSGSLVVALVRGPDDPVSFRARIAVRAFGASDWARVESALVGEARFAADLLNGRMPPGIEAVFAAQGLSLLPLSFDEVALDCSCERWPMPCAHLAATCYALARAFESDPFEVFTWRGRSRDELLMRLRRLREARAVDETSAASPAPGRLAAPNPATASADPSSGASTGSFTGTSSGSSSWTPSGSPSGFSPDPSPGSSDPSPGSSSDPSPGSSGTSPGSFSDPSPGSSSNPSPGSFSGTSSGSSSAPSPNPLPGSSFAPSADSSSGTSWGSSSEPSSGSSSGASPTGDLAAFWGTGSFGTTTAEPKSAATEDGAAVGIRPDALLDQLDAPGLTHEGRPIAEVLRPAYQALPDSPAT
ncbi:hypothetical protein [Actinoplanes couchii]|uniref:SWIM-type domain-containing protein n=1 Tax=Actinoplanes couchii TaxID=403638 RepID=A0ABQ3X1L9_9ACTN|nr:hypothetical protein [Actinoplanes couchii]MDR6316795.1 putative Zn finger protein [Actinoplanes couchii]GID52402.1 hypothetical protein Aco03nite_008060 [Actinoplanes couchii]